MPQPPRSDPASTIEVQRTPVFRPQGLKLAVSGGPDRGKTASFAKSVIVIGRGDTADFRLTDPAVSSFHVEITSHARGVAIRDLSSKNHTMYRGAELEKAIVPSGAELQLGGTTLSVAIDLPIAERAEEATSFGELRGSSAVMRELFALLTRLARTDLSVVLEGPTGTGKELAARALHAEGRRARDPFVVLDCAAIPATLAESVLFGHEKGAFTGATERRAGVFEAADGGTLFLDEIGELPVELQPKLLRALERREIVRVGDTKPRAVDVRIVSATWRDLRAMINQSRFREDLYYRIAQAHVSIPALHRRTEDIALLIRHFLERLPRDSGAARAIDADALLELQRRDYPGNARELKATVERAAMLAAGATITVSDLAFERMLKSPREHAAPDTAAGPSSDRALTPFKEAKRTLVDEFERDYLKRLMARTKGNLTRASALAAVERHHLRDLCKKHGLRSDG